MASNKRCNEEDGERENASANRRSTARSKKRRGGPSLVNFADTLIEFPTLVGPLVEVFTDASRNGPMNVQNLADRVRQISAAGNLYLPTDFSGLSLDVVIDDFQLLYDGNYLGEGKDYVWHTQQIMTGVPKGVKAMIPSHCFVVSAKLAHKYMKRTSESICRCMIDMVLLNVVDELVSPLYLHLSLILGLCMSQHKEVPGFPLLRISGEVAIKYAHDSSRKMWNGRVDYALGVERGGGAW